MYVEEPQRSESPAPDPSSRAALFVGIALAFALVLTAVIAVYVYYARERAALTVPAAVATPRDPSTEVRLTLYTTRDLRVVEENQRVPPNSTLSGTYRSLRDKGAHLIAFAIDAEGGLRWMVPSAVAAAGDAPSWTMVPSTRELPFPSSLYLRRAPAGPLRVLALVTAEPVRSSQIGELAKSELTAAALRARFHGDVREWIVIVRTNY